MKQLSGWTCGLMVNVSLVTFGSHEFDFLVYSFLFALRNLFRQLFTPTKYIWEIPGVNAPCVDPTGDPA